MKVIYGLTELDDELVYVYFAGFTDDSSEEFFGG